MPDAVDEGLGTSFAFLSWEAGAPPHAVETVEAAMDEFVSTPPWTSWLRAHVAPIWEHNRMISFEDRADFRVVARRTGWSCYVPVTDLSEDRDMLHRQLVVCLRRFYSVAARRAGLPPTPAFDDSWPS